MSAYLKGTSTEKSIQKQMRLWESSKQLLEKKMETPRPFVTISREYGCNAADVACVLEDELNKYENTDVWRFYDRECRESGLSQAGLVLFAPRLQPGSQETRIGVAWQVIRAPPISTRVASGNRLASVPGGSGYSNRCVYNLGPLRDPKL